MAIDKVSSFLFARSLGSQQQSGSQSEQSRVEREREVSGREGLGIAQEAALISRKSDFLLELSDRRFRVEELKQQYAAGQYQLPDSQSLARSFLEEIAVV